MTKTTDTSREAVEQTIKELLDTEPDGSSIAGWPVMINPNGEEAAEILRALLTERDALQTRAERAEAGLKEIRDMGVVCASDFAANTLAQLDAEPAGVSGQTHREGWEQAKEAAAEICDGLETKSNQPSRCAKDIRAMPYPGDGQ